MLYIVRVASNLFIYSTLLQEAAGEWDHFLNVQFMALRFSIHFHTCVILTSPASGGRFAPLGWPIIVVSSEGTCSVYCRGYMLFVAVSIAERFK